MTTHYIIIVIIVLEKLHFCQWTDAFGSTFSYSLSFHEVQPFHAESLAQPLPFLRFGGKQSRRKGFAFSPRGCHQGKGTFARNVTTASWVDDVSALVAVVARCGQTFILKRDGQGSYCGVAHLPRMRSTRLSTQSHDRTVSHVDEGMADMAPFEFGSDAIEGIAFQEARKIKPYTRLIECDLSIFVQVYLRERLVGIVFRVDGDVKEAVGESMIVLTGL